MMTALYLDEGGSVFTVDIGDDTLKGLQALVDGWVDCARTVDGTLDVWVNDEGLYRSDFTVNLMASFLVGRTLVGPAVLASLTMDGRTVGVDDKHVAALERQGMRIFDNDGAPYTVAEILAMRE